MTQKEINEFNNQQAREFAKLNGPITVGEPLTFKELSYKKVKLLEKEVYILSRALDLLATRTEELDKLLNRAGSWKAKVWRDWAINQIKTLHKNS